MHASNIFNMASEKKTMDSKNILNLKLLKYRMKVPTQDVDLKYGSILDSNWLIMTMD